MVYGEVLGWRFVGVGWEVFVLSVPHMRVPHGIRHFMGVPADDWVASAVRDQGRDWNRNKVE
jgi:hypothetical protein